MFTLMNGRLSFPSLTAFRTGTSRREKLKTLSIVLCITLLVTSGINVFPAFAQANASEGEKHWVYDELADFKQKIYPLAGKDSRYDGISEEEKNIIRNYILNEEYLDQPIKVRYWAVLLNAVLKLPSASKDRLLKMYVYDLATEDEIAREDAVGGMVKLLTIQYLQGYSTAEELKPAEALQDLHALSDRQSTLVRMAYSAGLIDSNTTAYFRPKERLTVAEAVSMLYKVILKYNITYDDAQKDDKPESGTPDDLNEKACWVDAEIQQYRDRLQKKLVLLKTAESVLLDGRTGNERDILNEAVTAKKWSEVLKMVLEIEDEKVLQSYTTGLVEGETVPRDVAVAGMMKLLHYTGMVKGRDASEQERLEAANAFTDCKDAFDTSKLAIAYSERLIEGYPDHTFRPKQNITKGEALILMLRIMEMTSAGPFGSSESKDLAPAIIVDEPREMILIEAPEKIETDEPAITVEELREVIPDTLEVSKTISDYAHGQHIIWVEGRFKHTEGELYLTLLDRNGQQLQSGGIRKSDAVKQIDDQWSYFGHTLIEDTGKVVETDKVAIVFHLNKEGKNQKGLLDVPAKKPVGNFTKDYWKITRHF